MATYIQAVEQEQALDKRSDRERIKQAFRMLRKSGYACRMNYMCCGSCAAYGMETDYPDKPHVFWNRQTDDAFLWPRRGWGGSKCEQLESVLYLSWSGDANIICDALIAEGLNVVKPDSDALCVEVWPSDLRAGQFLGMYPKRKEV